MDLLFQVLFKLDRFVTHIYVKNRIQSVAQFRYFKISKSGENNDSVEAICDSKRVVDDSLMLLPMI